MKIIRDKALLLKVRNPKAITTVPIAVTALVKRKFRRLVESQFGTGLCRLQLLPYYRRFQRYKAVRLQQSLNYRVEFRIANHSAPIAEL